MMVRTACWKRIPTSRGDVVRPKLQLLQDIRVKAAAVSRRATPRARTKKERLLSVTPWPNLSSVPPTIPIGTLGRPTPSHLVAEKGRAVEMVMVIAKSLTTHQGQQKTTQASTSPWLAANVQLFSYGLNSSSVPYSYFRHTYASEGHKFNTAVACVGIRCRRAWMGDTLHDGIALGRNPVLWLPSTL